MRIWVFADAPGNDHYNLNGEYVVLVNQLGEEISIGNWVLCDAASHCYTLPSSSMIAPSDSVILYTGRGEDDGRRFYMIWDALRSERALAAFAELLGGVPSLN